MNVLSFFSVIVFVISLLEGLFLYFNEKKVRLNLLFLFISLCLAIWVFGTGFAYSAPDKVNLIKWHNFSSIGYIFLHAFTLHFSMEYSGIKKRLIKIAIYLPSLIFVFYSFNQPLVFVDYEKSGSYWLGIPNLSSPALLIFILNYLFYYFLCILILYQHQKKVTSNREKKQSRIIILSLVFTIACYNIEPFLLSFLFNNRTYGVSPIFSIIWISGIWFAVKKYKFLSLGKNVLSREIFSALHESIILLDYNLNIILINETAKKTLGIDMGNVQLNEIIVEYDFFINKIKYINKNKKSTNFQLNFIDSFQKNIPMKINLSILVDKFQDIIGYIVAADPILDHDLMVEKYSITKREYEIIKLLMSGRSNKSIAEYLNISERTIKSHIANIYNKLGINNKFELLSMLKNYH